jgi:malate synthase
MGGMAAFVPSRRDPEVNEVALTRVRDDKRREAGDGFDGTWVAHPDLVSVATEEFDAVLGTRPNQVERLREEVDVAAGDLLDVHVPEGEITDEGVRMNVSVGLRYLESWLRGSGAVAIYNLMEDAATAEISRSQIWQWLRHGRIEREQVVGLEEAELAEAGEGRWTDARALFDEVALSKELTEFLTLPAYELID